jgi:hypothetical protein
MKNQIFELKTKDFLQNIICKTYYPKGLSRGFILNKKSLLLLDSSDNFSSSSNSKLFSSSPLLGMNLKKVYFKSMSVKNLFFTLYTPNFSFSYSQQKIVSLFRKNLTCLSKLGGLLLLLYPLKGGFSGLLNGFIGYIRTKVLISFFLNFINKSFAKWDLAFYNFFFNNTFIPRIPISNVDVIFFPTTIRPIFRKRKIKVLKQGSLRILFKL